MRQVCKVLLLMWVCISFVGATELEGDPASNTGVNDKEASRLWINFGGFSSHFHRDRGYNENNTGLGLEYRLDTNTALMVGGYYNSVRKNTSYIGINYQPLEFLKGKVGFVVGVMDGYPAMKQGGVFFVALPMATWEGRHWGLNVGLIPEVSNVDGAVVFQIKFRL